MRWFFIFFFFSFFSLPNSWEEVWFRANFWICSIGLTWEEMKEIGLRGAKSCICQIRPVMCIIQISNVALLKRKNSEYHWRYSQNVVRPWLSHSFTNTLIDISTYSSILIFCFIRFCHHFPTMKLYVWSWGKILVLGRTIIRLHGVPHGDDIFLKELEKNASYFSLYYYSYTPLILHLMFQWGRAITNRNHWFGIYSYEVKHLIYKSLPVLFFFPLYYALFLFFLLCLILFFDSSAWTPGRVCTCVPTQVIHWLMIKTLAANENLLTPPLFISQTVFTWFDLNQNKKYWGMIALHQNASKCEDSG